MPIEIKELVIRTLVGASAGVASGHDESRGSSAAASQTASTEDIVQACVRQVLTVLKKDKER
jgi:hypothetical protein